MTLLPRELPRVVLSLCTTVEPFSRPLAGVSHRMVPSEVMLRNGFTLTKGLRFGVVAATDGSPWSAHGTSDK